jgi:hypothetical protein
MLTVRNRPCSSCPYRRDVPSGIWAPEEYAKLPRYDAPTGEQPPELFHCHQRQEQVCAGWAGCHDMANNLAVRFALLRDRVGPEIFDYISPVPLFASGAEAAEHGRREIDSPGPDARRKMGQLHRMRARRTDR